MQIIRPCHNIPAEQVKNWKEIKKEALELRKFIKKPEVEGYYKAAYAISHAQVSNKPKNFFVLSEVTADRKLIKMFGSWCIINLKIVQFGDPVYWKEACMSFPFRIERRVDRMNKITVKYRVPFFFWSRPVVRKFEGLPAFICQHETEHGAGKNIYGK